MTKALIGPKFPRQAQLRRIRLSALFGSSLNTTNTIYPPAGERIVGGIVMRSIIRRRRSRRGSRG
jgi:hypothetical protein